MSESHDFQGINIIRDAEDTEIDATPITQTKKNFWYRFNSRKKPLSQSVIPLDI